MMRRYCAHCGKDLTGLGYVATSDEKGLCTLCHDCGHKQITKNERVEQSKGYIGRDPRADGHPVDIWPMTKRHGD